MHEIFDQIIGFLRGVWRYHWYAIIAAWIIVVIGWAVVFRLPDVYESSARVYVETDSILNPLLSGLAIRPNIDQRLELLTRTLLSRPNVERIVQLADLDLLMESSNGYESLVNKVGSNIHIAAARRENLYTISYKHKSPEIAHRIVDATVTVFTESMLGRPQSDTDSAQRFLMQQIRDHEQRLIEMENRIKEFKRDNMALIGGAGEGYFDRLQQAQRELAQARLEFSEVTNRRDELRRQIRGESPTFGFGNDNVQSAQLPIDARIEELQLQLENLQLKFTDNHPEVMNLQTTIERMQRERQEMLETMPAHAVNTNPVFEQNPVYQQMRIALGDADARAAALKARVSEYESRVAGLKKLVDTALDVETRMISLNRDYDVTQKNYDALVERLETAKMTEEADQSAEDISVTVIDPARMPEKPSGPDRTLFSSAILALALGGGVMIAFVLSQIRPVVYDRGTLQQISGLPVFGTVSVMMTNKLRRRKRLDIGGFVTASVGLIVTFALIVLVQVHGISLDEPGEGILRMIGTLAS